MQVRTFETWNDTRKGCESEVRCFWLDFDITGNRSEGFTVVLEDVATSSADCEDANGSAEFIDRIPDDYIESIRLDMENFLNDRSNT